MYCKNCGTEVTGNFCPNCGTAVASETAALSGQNVIPAEKKKDRFSKPIFIFSLVASVLLFICTFYSLFSTALFNSMGDTATVDVAIIFGALTTPFALFVLLGAALRGKSKIAAAVFYLISIFAFLFLFFAGLGFSDDFLYVALLGIPFIILTWIFGARCAEKKVSKSILITYFAAVVFIAVFMLWFFSGEIALTHAANDLFNEMGDYSFMDEVETANNLLE